MDWMGNTQSNPSLPTEEGKFSLFRHGKEYRLISTVIDVKRASALLSGNADLETSPLPTPPSAQPPRTFDKLQLLDDEESVDFGEFDLDGFTQEEVLNYNSMAEPGQRLQDAVAPQKMQELMQETPGERGTFCPASLSTEMC